MAEETWWSGDAAAQPDLALVRRIARGEQGALDELYERFAPGLLAYLNQRLSDSRLAEEVLQDVMLAAWNSAGRFRGECQVRTWLLAIARNRAINAYHRQIAPRQADLPWEDAETQAHLAAGSRSTEASLAATDLRQALETLPDELRETLELVFFHGLSMEDTGRVLGAPLGTVKSRLHRAKARLRAQLGEQDE